MSSRPQDYPPPAQVWNVLIEETVRHGDGQRWVVTVANSFPDREAAVRDAAYAAQTYRPRHPARERGRWVYRVDESSWTVIVQGAMSVYHFRVFVGLLEAFVPPVAQ